MAFSREYPERPVVSVGGVIVDRGRTVLIRRGTEPLLGQWSIPGGTIEIGETIEEAVRRELREETGLEVRVLELIALFDRIYLENGAAAAQNKRKPRYHCRRRTARRKRRHGFGFRAGRRASEISFDGESYFRFKESFRHVPRASESQWHGSRITSNTSHQSRVTVLS
jgi:NUDIX domain-containing protein